MPGSFSPDRTSCLNLGRVFFVDFESLVRRHKDTVYRQMLRVCGSHEDAEDALSTALLKAYSALGSLENEESFRPWLVQIGRRVCGRMKHKEHLRPVFELEGLEQAGLQISSPDASPEEIALEDEMRRCLLKSMEELPPLYREAYSLVDLQEVSLEDAAEKLDISVPALKSRLHRARTGLRDKVEAKMRASGAW